MNSNSSGVSRALDALMPAGTAYAHCDIPCGIYDPHLAQVAAHTVVRMNTLINDLTERTKEGPNPKQLEHFAHDLARYVAIKEKHAEMCKHEVRILWGEFFKDDEDFEKWPELHELSWKIMKLGSTAKQNVDMQVAEDLLAAVNRLAEIFWEKKGVDSYTATAPYPTERPMVLPKLE